MTLNKKDSKGFSYHKQLLPTRDTKRVSRVKRLCITLNTNDDHGVLTFEDVSGLFFSCQNYLAPTWDVVASSNIGPTGEPSSSHTNPSQKQNAHHPSLEILNRVSDFPSLAERPLLDRLSFPLLRQPLQALQLLLRLALKVPEGPSPE